MWLASLLAAGAAILRLRNTERSDAVRRGLRLGSTITVGTMLVIGVAMLVSFEAIFDGFHEIFFEPGTWTFGDDETLRRLYPDAFWESPRACWRRLLWLRLCCCAFDPLRTGESVAPG